MTIDGEDAYESNGVQNHYVVFTGGDDWSKEQIDEGQYRYTFRLGETIYHAQIHKYNNGKISEAPDGNRMRIQFGEKASEQYVITIYFWMDMPHMNGYLAAVNDVFVYHQSVMGFGSDITCTVTEVGVGGSYDADVDGRSGSFRDYMYPVDNSGAIRYLHLETPGNTTQYAGQYVYTIESKDVLGGAKQCYVITESVYSRSLADERVELFDGVTCVAFYGLDNGLLYHYAANNTTLDLTSKPDNVGTLAQYQATLNANGGTFSEDRLTVSLDYQFKLEDYSEPSKANRAFNGWNTQADGSGRAYVYGDTYNSADLVDGRIVLYAQWIIDGYYLNIIADTGGTPESAIREVYFSEMNHGELTHYVYEFTEITAPNNKAAGAYRVESMEIAFESVIFQYPNYSFTSNGDGTYRYGGDSNTYRKFADKEVYYYLFEYQLEEEMIRWLHVIPGVSETVDIHLVWTEDVTNVTFHSNYGLDETTVITYAQLSGYDGLFPAANLFERENYTFIGWGPTFNAEPYNTVAAGIEYDTAMGTTFWAIWDKSMTVTYNANGGNGTVANQNILLNGNNHLSTGSAFSREGYMLVGWADSADSTTLAYQKGAEFTMEESQAGTTLSLYALWATGTYTVHFNIAERGNGVFVGEMEDQVIGVGITTKLNTVRFDEETGFYEFGYWTPREDGGDPKYYDKAFVTDLAAADGSITLNAWWEPVKYIVHYVLNPPYGSECDGEMADQIIDVGEPTALSNCGFNGDENYAFSGWNTEYNGTGTSYTNGQIVTDLIDGGATFTLYAQWRSTKYTVNFDENLQSVRPLPEGISITGEMDSQIIRVGETVELSACGFAATNTYFTFTGWNTDRNGSGDRYDDGAEVEDLAQGGATITLFAQWVRTSYTLVFYAGENPDEREWEDTGSMEEQNRQVGDGLSLPACTFTPLDGVVFDHWEVDYGDRTADFEAEYRGDITYEHGSAPKVTAVWRLPEPEE